MKRIFWGSAALCLVALPAWAADAPKSATYITPEDMQKVMQLNGGPALENAIRMMDMGKDYQLSATMIYRGSTEKPKPTPVRDPARPAPVAKTPCGEAVAPTGAKIAQADMLSHDDLGEIYIITKGEGTIVTGGTMFGGSTLTSNNIGPSCSGKVYGDFEARSLKVGDTVVLPQGVPHGFSDIPNEVEYLNFRIDSKHVLPSGTVSPALKK